ncbi:MAG: PEGA domain-containing protein [Spirochaeta sp.]|nr:PEGA domain-containing protein [Spirochaeta sp.]
MRYPKGRNLAHLVILLALLLVWGAPLGAADTTPRNVDELLPADAGEIWRLGFAALTYKDEALADEHKHLSSGIPLLLVDTFSELEQRMYTDEERAALAQDTLQIAQRDVGLRLKELRDRRDAVMFTQLSRREREDRYATLAGQVRTAEMELARLVRYDPDRVELPFESRIQFVEDETGVRQAASRPAKAAREAKLDGLVYGSLEPVGEYLYLELALYSEVLDRDLGRVSLTALPEELASLLYELEDELAALLLGRDVARLAVSSGREDIAVFLDDELLGYGNVERRFLLPGRYAVRIEGRNLPTQSKQINLEAQTRSELVFELEPVETSGIIVESLPSGADVYSDSVWIGRTPLRVELGESDEHIVLLRKGFYRSQFILGTETPTAVQRDLELDRGGEGGLIEDRRNGFYMAFGLFVLSVPIAVLSNGVYENLSTMVPPGGGQAPGLSESEADRLRRQRDMAYYATWGGVAVSTGLFVTSAIQLGRYIRAAQAAHTR